MLDLEMANPAWQEVLASSLEADIPTGGNYTHYNDGRPASRHHYYGITLNETDDRIMLVGGSFWDGGGLLQAVDSYNITANTFNAAATHPDFQSGQQLEQGACIRDPATDDIYLLGVPLHKWTRSTNTWSNLSPTGKPAAGTECPTAFDTSRARWAMIGGWWGHYYYTLSTNTFTPITLSGARYTEVYNDGIDDTGEQSSLVYVPALDVFLFRKDVAGGEVYQIHPTTFAVTMFSTSGGASIPVGYNGASIGIFNKFLYVPRLGGCVYVPTYPGNAWFLKTG